MFEEIYSNESSSCDLLGTKIPVTKLLIPPLLPKYLARPRLKNLYEQMLAYKISLVSAPPGYGKTTFVNTFLYDQNLPIAWINLDERDNKFDLFWYNIISAIQKINPEPGKHERQILINNDERYELALTGLINSIAETIPNLVVVLRGYHHIEIKSIHKSMAFFMEYLPPGTNMIITSCEDPPLPLPRLQANGYLLKITTRDLRFDLDETIMYLNDIWGFSLTPQEVNLIWEKMDGWAAGLYMVALNFQSGTKNVLTALNEGVALSTDFLVEEVIAPLDSALRDFLMGACVLDRFSAVLCDALMGISNSQESIQMLREKNLFIEPLDVEGEWFQFQSCFRKTLYQMLRKNKPRRLSGLHKKASDWYQEQGQFDESIEHAISAGDHQQIGELLRQLSPYLIGQGIPKYVHHWLKEIPEDYILHDFILCILSLYASWRPYLSMKSKEYYYSHAKSLSKSLDLDRKDNQPETFTALAWMTVYEAAEIVLPEAGAAESIDLLLSMMKRIPPSESMALCVLYSLLGLMCARDGKLDEAQYYFEKSIPAANVCGFTNITIVNMTEIAYIRFYKGHLQSALVACEEACKWGTGDQGEEKGILWITYMLISYIYYQQNQLEQARDTLQHTMKLAEIVPDKQTPFLIKLGLAHLELAMEETEIALELGIRAKNDEVYVEQFLPYSSYESDIFMTRLWLLQENISAAKDYARPWSSQIEQLIGSLDHVEPVPRIILEDLYKIGFGDYWIDRAVITFLQLKIASKEFDGLSDLIDIPLQEVQRSGAVAIEIQFRIMKALLFQATQQMDKAVDELLNVLQLAKVGNWVRAFTDKGVPMYYLLLYTRSKGYDSPYVSSLLSSFQYDKTLVDQKNDKPKCSIQKSTKYYYHESLTKREFEILGLVSIGMSDQDIADNLILSLQTVRNYNHSIYQKLGVDNRTQASLRAREKDLIKSDQ